MSKTFKSAFEDSSYRLEVCKNAGAEHVSLWILGCGLASTSIAIADKDSPALALAILEASGVESPYYNLGDAVSNLRQHVEREAKHLAEAKEQAELEAEALELFKASGTYGSDRLFLKFNHLDDHIQKAWLAVARKAREIGAKK